MINETYKEYVLETAYEKYPVRKKPIYTYSYYYDTFLIVLKHVNSWRSISITSNYSGKSRYHYTTIRKMFNKCSKFNVFKINAINLIQIATMITLFLNLIFRNNCLLLYIL